MESLFILASVSLVGVGAFGALFLTTKRKIKPENS